MVWLLVSSALAGTVTFDLGGVWAKGTALTVAPVGGDTAVGVDSTGYRFDGILELLISDSDYVTAKGETGELFLDPSGLRKTGVVTLNTADGTKLEGLDSGLHLIGDPVAAWAALPEGTTRVRAGIGDACECVGDASREGQGDACDGDEDNDCREGQGDACDGDDVYSCVQSNFVFGTTSYLETRQGNFVFGTTTYLETRQSQFVFGTTSYFRGEKGDTIGVTGEVGSTGVDGTLAADFGTELCQVGVWDAAGLVLTTEVACAKLGSFWTAEGTTTSQVPRGQASALTANEKGTSVPQLTWSWADDGSDPSEGVTWIR
jgi:hypothetical protein